MLWPSLWLTYIPILVIIFSVNTLIINCGCMWRHQIRSWCQREHSQLWPFSFFLFLFFQEKNKIQYCSIWWHYPGKNSSLLETSHDFENNFITDVMMAALHVQSVGHEEDKRTFLLVDIQHFLITGMCEVCRLLAVPLITSNILPSPKQEEMLSVCCVFLADMQESQLCFES